ncbi:uncharacterized protein DNG_00166 [Cephalotrichum gorgonifer]|uniref:DUF7703 domain-containing protein n=1 Tax=Cephalotrichum gorgonifer TaxID=2041049 RepID=A0AAE8SQM1_9PEZI|nr:uncharacterized protein DNG_00166 [Cephalotrichum gorgonifer]
MNLGNHDGDALLDTLLSARSSTAVNAGYTVASDDAIVKSTESTLHNKFFVVAFISIALYNVIELTCIILGTFKKRSGLYFWSFCVATAGIAPYSIAFLLIDFHIHLEGIYGYVTMIVIGWSCTVTGQSLVLYSRLHLIDHKRRHLRLVLAMIITNAIVLHSLATIMIFGANSTYHANLFRKPYSIVEKVQVTIFFLQELTISLLYIWATCKYFHQSTLHARSDSARLLWHLIAVNVVVIILDCTILGLQYADLYELQTAYKGMAYSVKLKLEFRILNDLVNITRTAGTSSSSGQDYLHSGSRTVPDSLGSSVPRGSIVPVATRNDPRAPPQLTRPRTVEAAARTHVGLQNDSVETVE